MEGKQTIAFVAEDHKRAQITVPIHQQLTKFVWIKGLANYKTQQQTTNSQPVFIRGRKNTPSKFTFGSTQYTEEEDVERFYLFLGFNTWFIDQKEIPYVEFSRLILDNSRGAYLSSSSYHSNNSKTIDSKNSNNSIIIDSTTNQSSISDWLDDDDDENWDDAGNDSSNIDIEAVFVDTSVSDSVIEMCKDQERIAHQSIIQPKQLNSTRFSTNYFPPGRIFHSICKDTTNEDIYVYGGFAAHRSPCSLVTKFSLENDKFIVKDLTNHLKLVEQTEARDKLGTVPFREGHAAIFRKGKMYVLAGNAQRTGTFEKEILEFDFETGKIRPVPAISRGIPFSPRAYHSAVYISKRDVMVVYGGKLRPGLESTVSNELFIFHFKTLTWEKIETEFILPKLSGHHVFKLNNDVIGIIGGVSRPYSEEHEDLNSKMFIYNLEYHSFSSIDLEPYGYKGRYSMPVCYSEESQLLAIGAGHINDETTEFTVIYFDSINVNYEHFNKPLLASAFGDVIITCCND